MSARPIEHQADLVVTGAGDKVASCPWYALQNSPLKARAITLPHLPLRVGAKHAPATGTRLHRLDQLRVLQPRDAPVGSHAVVSLEEEPELIAALEPARRTSAKGGAHISRSDHMRRMPSQHSRTSS